MHASRSKVARVPTGQAAFAHATSAEDDDVVLAPETSQLRRFGDRLDGAVGSTLMGELHIAVSVTCCAANASLNTPVKH
jgi:hypothetical protein